MKSSATMQGSHKLIFQTEEEALKFVQGLYEEYWDGQKEKFVLPQDQATRKTQSRAVRGTTHLAYKVTRTGKTVLFSAPEIRDFLTCKDIKD